MKIKCEVSTSQPLIDRVKVATLIEWLRALPDAADVRYDGIASGRIALKATWSEVREVEGGENR